ncbi:hypothetical protein THOM_0458, partial [Trachipleistophora hominis]
VVGKTVVRDSRDVVVVGEAVVAVIEGIVAADVAGRDAAVVEDAAADAVVPDAAVVEEAAADAVAQGAAVVGAARRMQTIKC